MNTQSKLELELIKAAKQKLLEFKLVLNEPEEAKKAGFTYSTTFSEFSLLTDFAHFESGVTENGRSILLELENEMFGLLKINPPFVEENEMFTVIKNS